MAGNVTKRLQYVVMAKVLCSVAKYEIKTVHYVLDKLVSVRRLIVS